VGADEDVVLDGHQLEKAAAVDAHAAADAVAELEHGEERADRGLAWPISTVYSDS